jgi:hypothetical protein
VPGRRAGKPQAREVAGCGFMSLKISWLFVMCKNSYNSIRIINVYFTKINIK